MFKIGSQEPSQRIVVYALVRSWLGPADGTVLAKTGIGQMLGVRNRLPIDCVSISPAMNRCGSLMKQSTKPYTFKSAKR